jgi:hypothetical protein
MMMTIVERETYATVYITHTRPRTLEMKRYTEYKATTTTHTEDRNQGCLDFHSPSSVLSVLPCVFVSSVCKNNN